MKLRKSISLILAICMIISLLPEVTFFASAAGVKQISTEYNFTRAAFTASPKDDGGMDSWLVQYATDTYLLNREVSTGEWKYAGGYVTSFPSTSFVKDYMSIYSSFTSSNYAAIIMEITVDTSAYYTPTFDFMKYNQTNVLNMWVAPKNEFDNSETKYDITDKDDVIKTLVAWESGKAPAGGIAGIKLGSVETYDTSTSLVKDTYTNDTAVYLAEGKHYLFIQPTKGLGWEKYQAGKEKNTPRLCPISLTLTREEPLPPLTDIEVPDQEIFVGEKLDVEDQIVWKSNGSLLEGTGDVTYEVRDNASGALLEGKDGNIYGRAQGNATLRVTGEMDGDIAYKDITVTVREDNSYSGAEQKMFFFLSGYADTSTALTFVADEMNAENFAESFRFSEYGDVRPWAMVSANVTRRNSKGAFFPHDGQYLDLSINDAGEWVAFKVKVPAPGKYAVDIGCYCYKNGGLAKIYMLPYDEEVMTFQNIADNIDTYASEETFAAEADTYIAEDANSGPKMQSMMGTFVADESLDYSKGYTDYLMIIKSDYSRINPARSYIYLHTINFVGSGNIAEAEIDITDSGIGIGETMEIYGVSAKNAVGGAFDLSGAYIEHSVKDGSEDILELTEGGKTFRAKDNGTAVIETLILLDGCAYVKETEITVAPELMSRAAYLYSVGNAVVGKQVELTSRIEQENRKVLSVGEIESVEIISEEPAGEVVTLLPDGKTLEAIGAGSVTVRGVVNARGKRYTTEEITVVVSPITTPYPASFSISFPRVSYSDNVEFLSYYERYTAERNWVFNKIVNYSSGYDKIKLSTYDHAAIVWKKNVEPRYIAFKTFFSAPGKYEVSLEGVSRYRAANAEVYAVPFSRENESNLESLMQTGNEYYLGHIDMYDPDESSAGIKNTVTAEGATGEIASAGEYLVVLKLAPGKSAAAGRDDDCLYIKHIHFKNKSAFSAVELKAENDVTQIEAGNKLALTPKLYSGDGSVIEYSPGDVSIVYTSDNKEIATVDENGTVTAVNEGKANITASVTLGKVTVSGNVEISVSDSSGVDTNLGITATVSPDTVFAYASTQIKLHVAMNSGRWVEIPYEYITWNVVSGEDFATVAEDGTVTGRLVGDIVIQPVVDENYKENISEIEIAPVTVHVVWDSTLTPSIYTVDERANAIENAKKYSWAKSAAKTAMSRADKYADKIDFLYNMVVPEGLPRSYHIGHKYDPRRLFCRYCGEDIGSEYGAYGFVADPMSREWKVQCPDCKRIFPSNDFGKFYQLGLSEDKNHWSYSDALQKHHEKFVCEDVKNGKACSHSAPADSAPDEGSEEWMQKDPRNDAWYEYYGYGVAGGYLTNDMYEDMDARWAVDDGLGYRQPYVSDPDAIGYDSRYFEKNGYAYYTDGGNTGPVYYSYIAYYLHEGVWYGNGVSPGVVKTALSSLINAFVYTGDEKYGRAGAILLDRIGDVYPDMYWHRWASFRGDNYRGDICDIIWSAYMGKMFAKSADAFLPIYNDPYVAGYLEGRGETYEADENGNYIRNDDGSLKPVNLKNSPGALRKHVEDNILLTIYDHMKRGMQSSNFGSHQSTLGAAAVALNKMPETKEMLDFMMQTGEEFSTGPEREEPEKGLNVMKKLIEDVTRDGMGNENSTHYNAGWLTNLIDLADTLGGYDGYKEVDLFANPKFTKMFTSHLRVTLGNYYCAQIGDASSTASTGIKISHNNIDDALVGFKYTKDRMLARAMYLLNGNTAEGLHYTILDKDPERLEDEVSEIVEEDGEFFLGSDMMTGFGFAALRTGAVHNSANAQTESNTSRDFGIYFGASAGHGHLDSLNLFIDAFGLNLAPDLGYPAVTGWDPNRYEWVRTNLSHNTVMVDKKEQSVKSVSGTPYHFDDNGRVRVMDVSSNAYENTDDYRRSVFMVDVNDDISYGVDFFHVKGGRDHLYSFHSQSDDLTVIKGLSDMRETPTYADPDGNLYGTYAGADVLYGADPGGVFNGQYPRGYTWLRNVRTFNAVDKEFTVEYKVKDWNKVLSTRRDIRLRLTMVNDEPMKEVTFAVGEAPPSASNKNIGELEYLLVRNTGTNLDTTFTTVFEPYEAGNDYVKSIEKVSMVRDEADKPGTNDSYGAVRVELKNGRTDYVIYSTNSEVSYVVDEKINFRGFGGVLSLETLNDVETVVASYLNDGEVLELISAPKEAATAAVTGKITGFTDTLSMENFIIFTPEQEIDANVLAGKYVYVENDGVQNGAYPIESARKLGTGEIELCTGDVTLIRSYVDANDIEGGYVYNVAQGQNLRIPLGTSWDSSPVVIPVDDISTSANSSVTVPISAYSPVGKDIQLIGTTLPRGMSINYEKMTLTWKPDKSQVGENHVAVTVTDGTMETTVHFTVTVYGATTGNKNEVTETPSTEGSGASGGGGGGGGGGAAPTDTPDTDGESLLLEEKVPSIGEADEAENGDTDNIRFIDLGNHVWAADSINSLADDGIVKGTTENTYSPANNITRADFALLLVRAFKLESDNAENFADVSANDYFASELAIARNTGIVNGIGDNKFAPRNTITRQDMMVIVYRAMTALEKMPSPVGKGGPLAVDEALLSKHYGDWENVADYAREAVSALISEGLVNGKSGYIAPTDYTTRAEVAVLIKRIMDYNASLA